MVRRAARERERITFVEDESAAAVLISASELEDLEDALAVAEARLREATGESARLTHDEVPAPPRLRFVIYGITWERWCMRFGKPSE